MLTAEIDHGRRSANRACRQEDTDVYAQGLSPAVRLRSKHANLCRVVGFCRRSTRREWTYGLSSVSRADSLLQEEDARNKIAYAKERERLDKEQQLRLDEKMAQRLQGEEDEHASKLREARRKNKELKAAQEANRIQMEKNQAAEKARLEAAEKERLERLRQKEEAKKNKTGFFSGGTGTSVQSASGTKTKRAPFNFEAVCRAVIYASNQALICMLPPGKAKDLAGRCYGFDACQRTCQCFAACQPREGICCQQWSSARSAYQAQGVQKACNPIRSALRGRQGGRVYRNAHFKQVSWYLPLKLLRQ